MFIKTIRELVSTNEMNLNLSIILSATISVTSLLLILTNVSFAQSDDKTFTASEFGLTMHYPSDWSFISSAVVPTPGPEDDLFSSDFCPSAYIDAEIHICKTESPVDFGIILYKLNDGTTLKEFYQQRISAMGKVKSIVGSPKNIETTKVNVSGLPAIQTISTHSGSGDSLGKLLKMIESESPTSKDVTVYVVNGSTGYRISGGTRDESDFNSYSPTLQKMIHSIHIEGAKGNEENAAFVPPNIIAPDADVVLLSQKLKKGGGDFDRIVSEVKNVGDDEVEFLKVGLTTYDNNGDVLGTDSTYATSNKLKPNQKSSFDLLSSKDNFEEMKSYQLSLQWQDVTGEDQYVENAQG
jgi:hypothetical protein